MTVLSVNINKVATLRNARGGNVPDVVRFAADCELFGAQGITVHPRPDERHIRYADVYALKKIVTTELNIEGYPSDNFIDLVCDVVPSQVTLVPDAPDDLTSHTGWNVEASASLLRPIIERFHRYGIRVSLFVFPDPKAIEHAKAIGADRVELYTEPYAANFASDSEKAIREYIVAAQAARQVGLGLNAGHDLNLDNLTFFAQQIPWLDEVSIGHALISDALYLGIEKTIAAYRKCLGHVV